MPYDRDSRLRQLTGTCAVVTGASRGIGAATLVALAEAGADVASIHIADPENTEQTVAAVERTGRRALMVDGSTTDAAAVEAFAERVEDELGPIDVWVNSAAIGIRRPFLEMSDEEDWHAVLDVNLHGYYYGCRSALRRMVPRRRGRIVNVSSVVATRAMSERASYVVSKNAIVGLTRALAIEFAPHGIGVNAIAPGAIATPANVDVYTPELRRAFEQATPAGRMGGTDDVVGAILFLASDAARFVVGQELIADGGLTLNGNIET
jgi:NAD(P)-dependent dehydrogenase (short-subunit alcohol dehydrogenase family)